ncbi:MAG TPA: glycosyltransferase family 4 protein [Candidatus Thermoplasmatota archaeon]|jgi:glycosyltransferase involved in cell wall biosynthesis|nr:glycosyltransferase family 4 protein [Candidatus Thermoplasmatota archaeon]
MDPLRVCLASQTPPAKFRGNPAELAERYPDLAQVPDLRELQEGVDYDWTTGGVPVMLRQLLASGQALGLWGEASWVALNPTAPPEYKLSGTRVRSVSLEPARLRAYASCKEKMWAEIHGLPLPGGPVTTQEFGAFTAYNWRTAREMLELLPESDVAFVHDFQLVQVGAMLGLSGPVVLRWHIPFEPHTWSRYFRNYVVRVVEDFDAVIVSCRRDLEGLLRSGYHGTARQVYPYLDPASIRPAQPAAREILAGKLGIAEDAPVVLCVSRMDPIKGQDRLITAFATVARKLPEARLVMVGNGSFTSSAARGLGHPKGSRWRAQLEQQVRDLRLQEQVRFTGYLPPELLDAAWERCAAVAQPSAIEGFGLTAVEAWLHGKPVVVSRGAGASELVLEGVSGYTYAPDDTDALASHVLDLLANPDEAARMARRGRETAQRCAMAEGAKAETAVLQEAVADFRRPS